MMKWKKFRNELTGKTYAMLEKENKPKTVWDLKDGDKYYTIYPRDIVCYPFEREGFDIQARENGNMFLTREEAEFELERRKIEAVMRKYSRPFEKNKENWFIVFNGSVRNYFRIFTQFANHSNYGIPYFESEEIAQQVIKKIGKDKLEKYWFGIGE